MEGTAMANKKRRKKFHLSKLIIPFVILSLFTFTGIPIYLQFVTQVELSATLITCFFAFCTGELWMLASIKKQKIKHNFVDDPNTPENEAEIYAEIYNQGREEALNMVRNVMHGNYDVNNNDNNDEEGEA
jgi:hypothetical protein